MASNIPSATCYLEEFTNEPTDSLGMGPETEETKYKGSLRGDRFLWMHFKSKLIWSNIVAIIFFHAVALYGLFTCPLSQCKITILYSTFMVYVAGFGVGAGVHRFWTHRSYKAKLPLRIILATCYLVAGQNSIYEWVRDHRVHHKFTETDGDPHNSNRGFFFSHVGWLMMKKHPEVLRRGRQIDMSDVLSDPVAAFCQKYFVPLKLLICFVIPSIIPVYLWDETWYHSIMSQVFVRYVFTSHCTWSVNSFAHLFGNKPYDKVIAPTENGIVSYFSMGEGWHNYHHVFPWDYKAAEFGNYSLNLSTMLIDMFAKIGWAYDLKEPTKERVRTIILKKGDGSHSLVH